MKLLNSKIVCLPAKLTLSNVIPAKAGIQLGNILMRPKLDPRLRGDDETLGSSLGGLK